ncbi:hypothetical protein LINGRAHAP2_LOCUS20198 [Linum grandiflorum]
MISRWRFFYVHALPRSTLPFVGIKQERLEAATSPTSSRPPIGVHKAA